MKPNLTLESVKDELNERIEHLKSSENQQYKERTIDYRMRVWNMRGEINGLEFAIRNIESYELNAPKPITKDTKPAVKEKTK